MEIILWSGFGEVNSCRYLYCTKYGVSFRAEPIEGQSQKFSLLNRRDLLWQLYRNTQFFQLKPPLVRAITLEENVWRFVIWNISPWNLKLSAIVLLSVSLIKAFPACFGKTNCCEKHRIFYHFNYPELNIFTNLTKTSNVYKTKQ